jgi:hypothetical protein
MIPQRYPEGKEGVLGAETEEWMRYKVCLAPRSEIANIGRLQLRTFILFLFGLPILNNTELRKADRTIVHHGLLRRLPLHDLDRSLDHGQ